VGLVIDEVATGVGFSVSILVIHVTFNHRNIRVYQLNDVLQALFLVSKYKKESECHEELLQK
jgi:hypothetical protein